MKTAKIGEFIVLVAIGVFISFCVFGAILAEAAR